MMFAVILYELTVIIRTSVILNFVLTALGRNKTEGMQW